jgi:PAS domain S-box-containing protein
MRAERIPILIVDDREEGLVALEAVLGRREYELVRASCGEQALELAAEREFALILLDVQMPRMDGFETARRLREKGPSRSTPIVFITAIDKDERYVFKGYELGAVDYLFKPFDAHVLRSKVSVFAQLHEQKVKLLAQAEVLHEAERAKLELSILRRYRNLADSIPHVVSRVTSSGDVSFFNRCWYEYTGLSPVQSVGRGWKSAVHPDDLARGIGAVVAARERGEEFALEARVQRHDGIYRWHLIRGVPDHDEAGSLAGWVITSTDIHDKRVAREQAEDAAARFRGLSELVPGFIFEHAAEGRTWVSPRWAQFCGVPAEELPGDGWLSTVHPDERERVWNAWSDSVARRTAAVRVEHRIRGADGSYRWFVSQAARVGDDRAGATRWVGVASDAQAFHDLEEQRADFLSLASHELKTPLAAVRTTLQLHELALRRGVGIDRQEQFLQRALRCTDRLNILVDDLLDFSRIESGRLVVVRALADLSEPVRETVAAHQSAVEASGRHRLVARIADRVEGEWDVSRLRQVTDNLVGNAIKYTPEGTIEVTLDQDGDEAVFSVRDEGIGIAEADLERIFAPFERAVDASYYGGLGIGLYVSSKIVELHRGRIHVKSGLGEGSTFTVRLPLRCPAS